MSANNARVLIAPEISGEVIILGFEDQKYATSAASLELKKDVQDAVEQARAIGRGTSMMKNLSDIVFSLAQQTHITSPPTMNEEKLKDWVSAVAESIDIKGNKPRFLLEKSGDPTTLAVVAGTYGRTVDQQELLRQFLEQVTTPLQEVRAPIVEHQPLTADQSIASENRGRLFVGKSLELVLDGEKETFNDQALLAYLELPTGFRSEKLEETLDLWHKKVERPPQEPAITVEDGKITAFTKPLDGRMLDRQATGVLLRETFQNIEANALGSLLETQNMKKEQLQLIVPIVRESPIQQLKNLNTLGINEMIGSADSTYLHSIPGRVYNVDLTSKRIHLSMVAPGETYSFNQSLGEVSKRTGFQTAYVIRNGRTELGDGGGVCQVSTTLFRASLNAGLPIVERHGHSYRVGYYEQNSPVGLDATVYGPRIDFRFKNDTPSHILVVTEPDPDNFALNIELWGTKDGRVSNIGENKIWDQTPPRATVYQNDTSLPPGKLKQVDWSAPGAKASFHYSVTRGSEILQDVVFKTTYQPWAAVYLRGV